MAFIWGASSFCVYLINFQMKYFPGNIFFNAILAAGAEIPMAVVAGFLFHRFGPKLSIPLFLTFALAGALCIIFLGGKSNFSDAAFITLAKCGIATPLFLCYLANSTIFPAIYAGTAFGFCNLAAKICSVFAPIVAELDKPIPMTINSVVIVLTIFAASMLRTRPEPRKT